jgi:hypothetical protein
MVDETLTKAIMTPRQTTRRLYHRRRSGAGPARAGGYCAIAAGS